MCVCVCGVWSVAKVFVPSQLCLKVGVNIKETELTTYTCRKISKRHDRKFKT